MWLMLLLALLLVVLQLVASFWALCLAWYISLW